MTAAGTGEEEEQLGSCCNFPFPQGPFCKKGMYCATVFFRPHVRGVVVFSGQDVQNFLIRPQTRLNNVNIIFTHFILLFESLAVQI